MSLLPPPKLTRRAPATLARLFEDEGRDSADCAALVAQVTTAYARLPFKGPALVLVGDVVLVDDTWRAHLQDELEELSEEGLVALERFDLELWLAAKIDREGSGEQRTALAELRQRLDESEQVMDDSLRYGLPSDIASISYQPMHEIEVYRDLSDVAGGDDDEDFESNFGGFALDPLAPSNLRRSQSADDDDDDFARS